MHYFHVSSFIISGFRIYGAAVVPDSGIGNTWQRLTLVLHEFLSNGLIPSRLHIVISFLTHADHVFLGLPLFLVPGSPNRVMELMHVLVPPKTPSGVWRTAVISSISFLQNLGMLGLWVLESGIIHYVHKWQTERQTADRRTDGQKQRLLPPSLCAGA